MTGGEGEHRGLTPRSIEEIFSKINNSNGNLEVLANILPDAMEATVDTLLYIWLASHNCLQC